MSRMKDFMKNKRIWALLAAMAMILPLLQVPDTYAVNTSAKSTKNAEEKTESFTKKTTAEKANTLAAAMSDQRYMDVDFFDYDPDKVNHTIHEKYDSGSKFLIGNGSNEEIQNNWTGSNGGVIQNLVQPSLDGSSNIQFYPKTLNLFSNNSKAGITSYAGYQLPLTYKNGYYQFQSGSAAGFDVKNQSVSVFNNKNTSSGTGKTVLSLNANYSHGHGLWPLDKASEKESNTYFGARFSTSFIMPENGKIVKNSGLEDMTFQFSGDGDVWVYVGKKSAGGAGMKLALDLGGIHDQYSGSINFATGLIQVEKAGYKYNSNTGKCSAVNSKVYWYLYSKSDYESAPASVKGKHIEKFVGLDFEEYAEYNFKMFYIERGAGQSSCGIKLNFPTIPEGWVGVQKVVNDGEKVIPSKERFKFGLFIGSKCVEVLANVPANDVPYFFKTAVKENQKYSIKEIFDGNTGNGWRTYYSLRSTATGILRPFHLGQQTPETSTKDCWLVTFSNEYVARTLKISKSIENEWSVADADKKEYSFSLYLNGSSKPVETITLHNGDQEVAFKTILKKGDKYQIKETAGTDFTGEYKVGDADPVKLNNGLTKVLRMNKDVTIHFTNVYDMGTVTVDKFLVEKGDISKPKADVDADRTFLYELKGKTVKGDTITLIRQITIPKGETSGTITFQQVPLGTYTVTELANGVYQSEKTVNTSFTLTGKENDATAKFYNSRTDTKHLVDSDVRENVGTFHKQYTFVK